MTLLPFTPSTSTIIPICTVGVIRTDLPQSNSGFELASMFAGIGTGYEMEVYLTQARDAARKLISRSKREPGIMYLVPEHLDLPESLNPGDELEIVCHYNTSATSSPLRIGPRTEDEMCNLLIYYWSESNFGLPPVTWEETMSLSISTIKKNRASKEDYACSNEDKEQESTHTWCCSLTLRLRNRPRAIIACGYGGSSSLHAHETEEGGFIHTLRVQRLQGTWGYQMKVYRRTLDSKRILLASAEKRPGKMYLVPLYQDFSPINPGDALEVECRYKREPVSDEATMRIGASWRDEMCDFLIYYWSRTLEKQPPPICQAPVEDIELPFTIPFNWIQGAPSLGGAFPRCTNPDRVVHRHAQEKRRAAFSVEKFRDSQSRIEDMLAESRTRCVMQPLVLLLAPYIVLYWPVTSGHKGCPTECLCSKGLVDCSYRRLDHVPSLWPPDTLKINLQGNNLTEIRSGDFADLSKVMALTLTDNRISRIEKGAFRDLSSLQRLDLSHNEITVLDKRTFRGAEQLKHLHLAHNKLQCILRDSFKHHRDLELISLQANNLTWIHPEVFSPLPNLRLVRLEWNPWDCSGCQAVVLSKALNGMKARLGDGYSQPRCAIPADKRGQLVTSLVIDGLRCSGEVEAHWGCESLDEMAAAADAPSFGCPSKCRCNGDGVVDCRAQDLTDIPKNIPLDSVEIRLEQNLLTEIPSRAFTPFKKLKRIDLSHNQISTVASDGFAGLQDLTSLVLYGNKISSLPEGLFHGLHSLELLLLNANQLKCIPGGSFKDLRKLFLLSLYDNALETLPVGLLDPLVSIQTLHLAKNEWVCDCHLRSTAEFLTRHQGIETSGAKCAAPSSMQKKKLSSLFPAKLTCNLGDPVPQGCAKDSGCPSSCSCQGSTVDCSNRHLKSPPSNLPPQTTKLILSRNQLETMEPGVFETLTQLRSLSLNDNKLTCLPQGAFKGLDKLQEVSLAGNQLECDCDLGWLSEWLQQRGIIESGARCYVPSMLAGKPIDQLPRDLFKCSNPGKSACKKLAADAMPSVVCPPQCKCEDKKVRCSHAKLDQIPYPIHADTEELYLDANEIKEVNPMKLKHLKNLQRLDLSNNRVSYLDADAFQGLHSLHTLILSYNKIECLHKAAFSGLGGLRILSLHGNEISKVPAGAFDDLHSISHLALGSNPLFCDCHLQWLSEWVKRDYVEPGIAKCHDPAPMRDQLILTAPSASFTCKEPAPPHVLAKCDACFNFPCRNGGTCESQPMKNFTCLCGPGYYGSQCEHAIDACFGEPCANGGTCEVIEEGRFSCHCGVGFTGLRCEENVDDCDGHKCRNNATCIDLIDDYRCNCLPGFAGEFCEKKIAACTKEWNPCANGGRCINTGSDYSCECPTGYHGRHCTSTETDCVKKGCHNGGTCTNRSVGASSVYHCICPVGFSGDLCEIRPQVELYAATSPCPYDCIHGRCYQPSSADYICKCEPGYSGKGSPQTGMPCSWIRNIQEDPRVSILSITGKRCETLTSVTLLEANSYVALSPLRTTNPNANITLVFASRNKEGVLIYTGQTQHLAVELFLGRLRVSYNVGNHPVSIMYSFEEVCDGKPHRVEFISAQRNLSMVVDGGKMQTIVNAGPKESLEVSTPLFIGGIPPETANRAVRHHHLRNSTSLRGCIQGLFLNGAAVDMETALRQHLLAPGCQISAGAGRLVPYTYQPSSAVSVNDLGKEEWPKAEGKNEVEEREEDEDLDDDVDEEEDTGGLEGQENMTKKNPCENHKCHMGKCKPRGDTYRCRCRGGWSGKLCDQAPTCRKEKYRDYYKENGCRSRRPVTNARCRGKCGRRCCQVRKSKRRRIRLICNDEWAGEAPQVKDEKKKEIIASLKKNGVQWEPEKWPPVPLDTQSSGVGLLESLSLTLTGSLLHLPLLRKLLEHEDPQDTPSLIQKAAEILRRPIVLIGEKLSGTFFPRGTGGNEDLQGMLLFAHEDAQHISILPVVPQRSTVISKVFQVNRKIERMGSEAAPQ
ncbi:unnamed protein product [Darwinula stevensoni]|uniref:Uncharacterized protein n=1 Tax=Darwinula stevensoni TaxID=69355 RepID=A0A7R8XEF7_9CRUS|nr:unnamed protein product [Darwinula stevensoni]CAG0890581.1 unnamed protein product [Darwinula stevensoni]